MGQRMDDHEVALRTSITTIVLSKRSRDSGGKHELNVDMHVAKIPHVLANSSYPQYRITNLKMSFFQCFSKARSHKAVPTPPTFQEHSVW